MNILAFMGNFGLQIKIFLILGLAIASFAGGWKVHGWQTDSKKVSSVTKQVKTAQGITKDAEPIVITNIVKQREIQYVYRTLKDKIHDLDDNRVCFTAESLSLWNRNITGSNTDSDRAESAGAPASTDTASAKEVLLNASDNFEKCNSNSVIHNSLLDKLDTLKNKMCVCAN